MFHSSLSTLVTKLNLWLNKYLLIKPCRNFEALVFLDTSLNFRGFKHDRKNISTTNSY